MRGNAHKLRVAAPVFRNHFFLGQFGLDPVQIGLRFVHLGDGHHHRHFGRLGVLNRFAGLRHHAVIAGHHQHHRVGNLGAARTHARKRGMAGRIEEGDHALGGLYVIGADVLCDSARLACGNAGLANVIK